MDPNVQNAIQQMQANMQAMQVQMTARDTAYVTLEAANASLLDERRQMLDSLRELPAALRATARPAATPSLSLVDNKGIGKPFTLGTTRTSSESGQSRLQITLLESTVKTSEAFLSGPQNKMAPYWIATRASLTACSQIRQTRLKIW